VSLPPSELLGRISTTMREEIGPVVTGDYQRTQAFMAAVVLDKLARQLALTAVHERAEAADRGQLFADLDGLLPAGGAPADVRAAVDEGLAGGGGDVVCRLIETLYHHRAELAEAFGPALGRVRAASRARVDRQMQYAT